MNWLTFLVLVVGTCVLGSQLRTLNGARRVGAGSRSAMYLQAARTAHGNVAYKPEIIGEIR